METCHRSIASVCLHRTVKVQDGDCDISSSLNQEKRPKVAQ